MVLQVKLFLVSIDFRSAGAGGGYSIFILGILHNIKSKFFIIILYL